MQTAQDRSLTDIHVHFPGGKRIEAKVGVHHIVTDQTLAHGGDDSAPEPFELFLASLATCAGLYVIGYCKSRGIRTEALELVQHHQFDSAGHLLRVELEILLPASFPDKDRVGVVRAAQSCKVKKTLFSPPEIVVNARSLPNDSAVSVTV
ncbi:MAG TPA: OsmC family protein [Polyangiaceae bacterium]